jgi:hypothetical protein
MARDVFVSYSQPDRERAFEIVEHLETSGITVWMAPRDIAPSVDWAAEIIEAIGACRIMVLVFSGASNDSPQVRREVERAVHRQLPILTLRVEDVLPTRSMEYFLSAQHWLDAFPPPLEPHYRRLCSHLKSQQPGAPLEQRAAAPAPGFAAPDLLHIERVLADYIGPLAKHLVRRAASQASDRGDLIARLSIELDAPLDRSAFAQRCLESPTA